ncbi:MAG: methionine--tRNA ligase [Nitrososphaeraceae archaeon]
MSDDTVIDENEDIKSKFITFDEFSRIKLKIGKIMKAENIPKMKKLLKVIVDIGNKEIREIVVGAAMHYEPNELEGKIVVVCTNLYPKKLGKILSNGMILAADGVESNKPIFLTIENEKDVNIGSDIH